jgi:hypothetical protein
VWSALAAQLEHLLASRVVLYIAPSWQHADRLDAGLDVTDVVRTEARYPQRAIALITFEGEAIEALGLATRGRLVATATRQLRISDFERVEPIKLDAVQRELPARVRRGFTAGLLTPRTGEETAAALVRLEPALQRPLERLAAIVEQRPSIALGRVRDVLALEKDAVGLAMSIAGLDRRPLVRWEAPESPRSFLEGLAEYRVSEDTAIAHDLLSLPGFEQIASGATGAAVFSDGRRRVTVVNVNRQPLERTLGVDLVYVNHTFDAFILVQYKRLRDEGRKGSRRLVFRPSADGSLSRELARMRKVPTAPLTAGVPASYRLNPGACYIKLCNPTTPTLTSPELVKGLYIPLDYWDCMAASSAVRGKRGGIVFSYDTVDRHLNNSLFVELARDAWIGSRGATSADLAKVVGAGVAAGRSLVVAAGQSVLPRS